MAGLRVRVLPPVLGTGNSDPGTEAALGIFMSKLLARKG